MQAGIDCTLFHGGGVHTSIEQVAGNLVLLVAFTTESMA